MKRTKVKNPPRRRPPNFRELCATAYGALVALQPLAPDPNGIEALCDQIYVALNRNER